MWSCERAVTIRRGFRRRDGDHRTDVYSAVRIRDPPSVGGQPRNAVQRAQRPRHLAALAGERRGDTHPRLAARARRLGPTDEATAEEEGALRVTAVDDRAATGSQVVHVDRGDPLGAGALHPGRDPIQRVGRPQGARPELAGGCSRGSTDLRHLSGTRVPGPDGEVVETGEGVVLRPDEPAAVEGAVCLVRGRIRERLDVPDRTRSRVDLRDPREARRVDRREEGAAIVRERERHERPPPREPHDVSRQHPEPGTARPGLAPAAGSAGRPGHEPVSARRGASDDGGGHQGRAHGAEPSTRRSRAPR